MGDLGYAIAIVLGIAFMLAMWLPVVLHPEFAKLKYRNPEPPAPPADLPIAVVRSERDATKRS